jgi:sporulation-control protein
MRKVLASVGIGNATVDTVLDEATVRPGERVGAEVRVEGGDAEQQVTRIELEVETSYRTGDGTGETTIDTFHLRDGFVVEPGERATYETAVDVPYETPLTMGDASVWVETDLEIPVAADPGDEDALAVEPTRRMQAVFDAAEALGLSFRSADCEADPRGRYVRRSFVQEFAFRPSGDPFCEEVDEVELVFDPGPDALTVYVEVDRQSGLLSELADADESTTSVSMPDADAALARRRLRDAIERQI